MSFKAIIAAFGMLALLGACDTMSEYGGKMSDSMSELGSSVSSAFSSEDGEGAKYVVYFKSNSTSLADGSESTLADALNAARNEKVAKARVVASPTAGAACVTTSSFPCAAPNRSSKSSPQRGSARSKCPAPVKRTVARMVTVSLPDAPRSI